MIILVIFGVKSAFNNLDLSEVANYKFESQISDDTRHLLSKLQLVERQMLFRQKMAAELHVH
jgi:hypothetical protein